MLLFNIKKEESEQNFKDTNGNPIVFGDGFTYKAEINQDVLGLILDTKKEYGTLTHIRQLIANIYNSNTYICHIFSAVANADEEHKELIYNILDTLKHQGTRFIVVNDVAPKVIELFELDLET